MAPVQSILSNISAYNSSTVKKQEPNFGSKDATRITAALKKGQDNPFSFNGEEVPEFMAQARPKDLGQRFMLDA